MNKKMFVFVAVVALLVFSPGVLAKNETQSGNGGSVKPSVTVSPTKGVVVQNQNQVKTQNQGDEQQLMVNTAEQENASVGPKDEAPRSEMAKQKMSVVASSVEDLLTSKTLKGGIGDQVREIAQEQKQTQDEIGEQVGKIESRGSLKKALLGSDYKALNALGKEMEKNEQRIEALNELMTKLSNQADVTKVKAMIEALIQQNVSLQEMADAEAQIGSMFGWLMRLFAQ